MKSEELRCERCGRTLNQKQVVWLELSNTDGNYYRQIPEGHVSQGSFSFGSDCVHQQLIETANSRQGINNTKW